MSKNVIMSQTSDCSGFKLQLTIWLGCFLSFAHTQPSGPTYDPLAYFQQWYRELCPFIKTCNGNTSLDSFQSVNQASIRSADCCSECSCEADCKLYHTCCPGTLTEIPKAIVQADHFKYGCLITQLKSYEQTLVNQKLTVWMIQTCDENYSDERVKNKCHSADRTDLGAVLPVSNTKTKVVYKNKFCAICNFLNEVDFVFWTPSINCRQKVFFPDSLDSLIEEVQERNDCNIWFEPNDRLHIDICSYSEINECNVTGKWERFDKLLEDACHLFLAPFNGQYSNVFCYLCNVGTNVTDDDVRTTDCTSVGPNVFVNFASLLDYREFEKEGQGVMPATDNAIECRPGQVFDPSKKACRQLHCKRPKMLADNGLCINMVQHFTGVCFEVFISFTTSSGQSIDQRTFINITLTYISHQLKNASFDSSVMFYKFYQTENSSKSAESELLIAHLGLFFRINLNGLDLLDLLSRMDGEAIPFDMSLAADRYYINVSLDRMYHDLDTNTYFVTTATSLIPLELIYSDYPMWFEKCPMIYDTVLLTKQSICSMVELNNDEFTTDSNGIRIGILEYEEVLLPNEFLFMENNNSVEVCVKDYLPKAERVASAKAVNKSYQNVAYKISAKDIMSFWCTCLSLTCLLLTFVTYSLFRELRTPPGKNNMALVGCLIVAQSLFQFGIDQKSNISHWACFTIGLLIHFSWLSVFCWMNVCCIHMFRVFTHLRQMNAISEGAGRFFLYFVYSFSASAVLIAINILASYYLSDHNNYGYVSELCYISTSNMVTFTFAMPAAIITLVNLSLFSVVVIQLCRMPSMEQSVNKTRNYFKVYAKLSSITGATWLLGFLYFFIKEDILEFLFIASNASQGVFIFLSFTTNKRVFNLYKERVFGKPRVPKQDTMETPVSIKKMGVAIKPSN